MTELDPMDAPRGGRAIQQTEQAPRRGLTKRVVPKELDGGLARVVMKEPEAIITERETVARRRLGERGLTGGRGALARADAP